MRTPSEYLQAAALDPRTEVLKLRALMRAAFAMLDDGQRGRLTSKNFVEEHVADWHDETDPSASTDACEVLLAAARRHGEDSEPDMEAGDLQILFGLAHAEMTHEDRKRFCKDPAIAPILDGTSRIGHHYEEGRADGSGEVPPGRFTVICDDGGHPNHVLVENHASERFPLTSTMIDMIAAPPGQVWHTASQSFVDARA